eukprot:scaffold47_cov258-Pinguiococcus_pyrenoidosus.AAC.116
MLGHRRGRQLALRRRGPLAVAVKHRVEVLHFRGVVDVPVEWGALAQHDEVRSERRRRDKRNDAGQQPEGEQWSLHHEPSESPYDAGAGR